MPAHDRLKGNRVGMDRESLKQIAVTMFAGILYRERPGNALHDAADGLSHYCILPSRIRSLPYCIGMANWV